MQEIDSAVYYFNGNVKHLLWKLHAWRKLEDPTKLTSCRAWRFFWKMIDDAVTSFAACCCRRLVAQMLQFQDELLARLYDA